MRTNVRVGGRNNRFTASRMSPGRLNLIAIALSISFSTGIFAAEVATPVAPLRLATRINGERWTGDLDALAKRRVLRILVVPSALGFYFNGSEMQGAMFELGRDLGQALNEKLKTRDLPITVVFIPVARAEMLSKLAAGYADIAGTIAERKQAAQVDYTEPLIPHAEGVVVNGPAAPEILQAAGSVRPGNLCAGRYGHLGQAGRT